VNEFISDCWLWIVCRCGVSLDDGDGDMVEVGGGGGVVVVLLLFVVVAYDY